MVVLVGGMFIGHIFWLAFFPAALFAVLDERTLSKGGVLSGETPEQCLGDNTITCIHVRSEKVYPPESTPGYCLRGDPAGIPDPAVPHRHTLP